MFLILFLLSFCFAKSEPNFQAPFVPKELNKTETLRNHSLLAIAVYKSSLLPINDPLSLWDSSFLKNNFKLNNALQEFNKGLRGQSLRKINVKVTKEKLHKQLLDLGFIWKEVPLTAGKNRYWTLSGHKTIDKTDPNLVMMQIYVHADGSMVRIKSHGIPDKTGQYPQRFPQILLAVLLDISPKSVQDFDTSYENEGFKVTLEGNAVPKSPSPKFGIKIPDYPGFSKFELKKVPDILMGMVHINVEN